MIDMAYESLVNDIAKDVAAAVKKLPFGPKHIGQYNVIHVNTPNAKVFDTLYAVEALTIEGYYTDKAHLDEIDKFFRESSKCNAETYDMYTITGKAISDYYHLTGNNRYKNSFEIIAIDWKGAGVKKPYKGGVFRWFSDIVDNNARREVEKKNPYYKHFTSMYYGDMGYEA